MKMNQTFESSLKSGTDAQIKTIELFKGFGIDLKDIADRNKPGDLSLDFNCKEIKIEVKNDISSMKTGNIFVELSKTGGKGLASINACINDGVEYILYFYKGRPYIFCTKHLYKVAQREKERKVDQKKVGSNTEYRGAVLPFETKLDYQISPLSYQGMDIYEFLAYHLGVIKK